MVLEMVGDLNGQLWVWSHYHLLLHFAVLRSVKNGFWYSGFGHTVDTSEVTCLRFFLGALTSVTPFCQIAFISWLWATWVSLCFFSINFCHWRQEEWWFFPMEDRVEDQLACTAQIEAALLSSRIRTETWVSTSEGQTGKSSSRA